MSDLFPGATNLSPLTRLRRERRLERPGDVAVRAGQQVSAVQIIARMEKSGGYEILSPTETFGMTPLEVMQSLLVPEGSVIEEGTPLLEKQGRFGRTRVLKSPLHGTLAKVLNGRLLLRRPPQRFELRSFLPGYVTNLIGNRGAVIETYGSLLQGLWSSGDDGFGTIAIMGQGPDHLLTKDDLDIELRGHILVAGHLNDIDVLRSAEDMGIRGIIVGSVPSSICLLADLFVMPLLVLDQIGKQPMSLQAYDLLTQSAGREASLLGDPAFSRHHRPELIIPLPATEDAPIPAGPDTQLTVGQTVRLLREPQKGQFGTVKSLPGKTRLLPNGTRSFGAEVELANGTVMFVADRNLEIII